MAVKMDWKILIENKSKFILAHSSSGFKHSLKGKNVCSYTFVTLK
jgi:protein pelota